MEILNYRVYFARNNTGNYPLHDLAKTCLRQLNRFFICLAFLAANYNSQAQDSLLYSRITISDTVCSVENALKLIENKTGLSFSYNSGLINRRKVIGFGADGEELIRVIRKVLPSPGLSFSIIGRHIVVYQPMKVLSANPDTRTDSVYYFEIRGRVMDKSNRQPLPYSSVYLVGKTIGIISNEKGDFVLKLNSRNLGDTLGISFIGYRQLRTAVSSLVNSNRDYLLIPDVISIQEVIIRKISPVNLLQSANNAVKKNYASKPSILTAFYRESVKRGNRFMMVSEAILENYKAGYVNTHGIDQVKIVKGRKSENIQSGDTVILKLKAGLGTMLLLDVVKNIPDFMTGESLADYSYRLADIVVDEGRDNYIIEFKPKELAIDVFYSGRIMLDVRTLAFKRIEFLIDPEYLDRATGFFIVRKPPNLKVKVLNASYKVGFRETGGLCYLHQVQCETSFRIRDRNQVAGSVYHTTLEMAVTDIDTVDAGRFRFREAAKPNEFFTDQIGEYDETFWGEYNFIRPHESLEEALVKLRKAQNAREAKEGAAK